MPTLPRRRVRGRPPYPDVLTPAEWRVLDEVRAGRSNPEIAERLGLSRNTVKTHVSSMLDKLGLRDRNELSEWLGRPEHTPARRDFALAPLGWGTSKVGVLAAVGVSALLVVAMAVAFDSGRLIDRGDEDAVAASVATEVPLAEPTGAPATPPSQATAAPSATATAVASGALFPPFTVGPSIEMPEGLVLFVWDGCIQCDGPVSSLKSFERIGGSVQERTLFERASSAPYILNGWVDEGSLYIAECSTGYCGGMDRVSSDATITLYRSADEGATWESLGVRAAPAGAAVADPHPSEWGVNLLTPAAATTSEDGVLEVGGVEFDVRSLDPRGVVDPSWGDAYRKRGVAVGEHGGVALRWLVWLSEREHVEYFTIFEADGTPVRTYEATAHGVWLDEDRLVGAVGYGTSGAYQHPEIEFGSIPSIIDLRDGTVRPIVDPFAGAPYNRNGVVGVITR